MSGVTASRLDAIEKRSVALDQSGRSTVMAPIVPNIMEFCLGPNYLGMERLYPRQGTLLKLVTLQTGLLTPYDYEVIAEWSAGFALDVEGGGYVGREGIAPDVFDRIEACRRAGRRTFKEFTFVGGRRGGKTYLAAILIAYQLLYLLSLGDPQRHFGMAALKRMTAFVFAGNREQAKANMYLDLRNLLEPAPVFAPFIAPARADTVRLWSPRQVAEGVSDPVLAAIEVSPKEATVIAGRGPASPIQGFDEMAWMENRGANRSAEEVYSSATPATQQFAGDEFIVCASSPWHQTGQFFENYRLGLEVNPDGSPAHPNRLVVHLSSLALYRDWERTGPGGIEITPGGDPYPLIERPIINAEEIEAEHRIDPDRAAVEFDAIWAATQEGLLRPHQVASIFGPYRGAPLVETASPIQRHQYRLHLDPAKFHDNFGGVLAHAERPDDDGDLHVVVDRFLVWSPSDFDDNEVDFKVVLADLKTVIDEFKPAVITIDQYEREFFMEHLADHIRSRGLQGKVTLSRYSATAEEKRERSLTFRRAAQAGLVHAPMHRVAFNELTFLQLRGMKVEAPTSGPVQTDDIADSLIVVTTDLLGQDSAIHRALDSTSPRFVSGPLRLPNDNPIAQQLSAAASRGQIPRGTQRMTESRRRRTT